MALNYQNGSTAVSTVASFAVSLSPGQWVILQNTGSQTVYIGGPNVTSTTAVGIAAGATQTIEAAGVDLQQLYAVTSTGTSTLVWLYPGD